MYHSISEDSDAGVSPQYRTAMRPDVFDSHMRYLHRHECTVLNLGEAVDASETDSN